MPRDLHGTATRHRASLPGGFFLPTWSHSAAVWAEAAKGRLRFGNPRELPAPGKLQLLWIIPAASAGAGCGAWRKPGGPDARFSAACSARWKALEAVWAFFFFFLTERKWRSGAIQTSRSDKEQTELNTWMCKGGSSAYLLLRVWGFIKENLCLIPMQMGHVSNVTSKQGTVKLKSSQQQKLK